MGTNGPQGNFDIQNFFKTSTSTPTYNPPPAHPFHASSPGVFPPGSFPSSSLPNFYPIPSQPPPPGMYLHYPPEHVSRPSTPYPSPPPFIQTSFTQSATLPSQSSSVQSSSATSPPLDGARLMALLTTQSGGDLRNDDNLSGSLELPASVLQQRSNESSSEPPPAISPALPTAPPVSLAPSHSRSRISTGILPKGRHLKGERVTYDIDVRLPGEAQPELEVNPITVYSSEPLQVGGRQVSVNTSFICYGLRAGTIRILNTTSALRHLLRGHTARVSDMCFFSRDVDILASASVEGRIFARQIIEDINVKALTERVLAAFHFVGDWQTAHPLVCWHPRMQEILFVAIGKYVLTIDTVKARSHLPSDATGENIVENVVKCAVDSPLDGVTILGTHDGDVTDLATTSDLSTSSGSTRLISSSKDGTVRMWGDKKLTPLAVFAPHSMLPVDSVSFITEPCRPAHTLLLTGGPLNRELKLWAPVSSDSWKCIQTLEFKASSQEDDDAFFNHVVVVPQASVIVIGNGKREAIYVVHVDFGSTPSATRMDYLAEFTYTYQILSITVSTGTSSEGDPTLQIYCVQTRAIQQYALDLSLCLPPVDDARAELSSSVSVYPPSPPPVPTFSRPPSADVVGTDEASNTGTVEMTLSEPLIDVETSTAVVAYDQQQQQEETKQEEGSSSEVKDHSQPHLVTPSELMSIVARSKAEIESGVSSVHASFMDDEILEAQKSGDENRTDEITVSLENNSSSGGPSSRNPSPLRENKGENINNNAVDVLDDRDRFAGSLSMDEIEEQLGLKMSELNVTSSSSSSTVAAVANNSNSNNNNNNNNNSTVGSSSTPPMSKGRKNKNKAGGSGVGAPLGCTAATNVGVCVGGESELAATAATTATTMASVASPEGLPSQLQMMQETMNQLVGMQKELQKQMAVMVSVPIAKEGKKMEALLGQRLEKVVKANVDAVWARVQEESAKREKADRERLQQMTALITTASNATKEIPAVFERLLKKELSALAPAISKNITPFVEKAVASALSEGLQKSVSERLLPSLEKSTGARLESAVTRQLQTQFQTTGRQAMQDAMRTCLEGSVVPGFERCCKAMFDQMDHAFQKGMAEHTLHAQQQTSASHNALASTLQDTVASANTLATSLKTEIADGQRKLVALAENANASRFSLSKQNSGALPDKVLSLQHLEESLDPTIELTRLLNERKLEEAFTKALSLSNVGVVSWLVNQVDPTQLFSTTPMPLSQGVILSLVQQLGCDLGKDTAKKLTWIREASLVLNPNDPHLAPHMRLFLDQLYQNLHRQVLVTPPGGDLGPLKLVMHVVNSLLTSCK